MTPSETSVIHLDPTWEASGEPTNQPPTRLAASRCGRKRVPCIPVNSDTLPSGTRYCVSCEHFEEGDKVRAEQLARWSHA